MERKTQYFSLTYFLKKTSLKIYSRIQTELTNDLEFRKSQFLFSFTYLKINEVYFKVKSLELKKWIML